MMTPEEYDRRFLAQKRLQPSEDGCTNGLCGRFMRGQSPEDFRRLSDEPGKVLSWVCSGEMLGGLLGMNAVDAMLSIGYRLDWIQGRIHDGTQFQLVVFPVLDHDAVVVTWDALWALIAKAYGLEVDKALDPFQEEIERLDTTSNEYSSIEGGQEICRISNLPTNEKHNNPVFLTVERFLAIKERSIYHARGFLDHSVGCNHRFTGTGYSPGGGVEMMTRNRPMAEIEGAVMIPLKVSQADLNLARSLQFVRKP